MGHGAADADWAEIAGKRVARLPETLTPEVAAALLADERCRTHGDLIPCLEVPPAVVDGYRLFAESVTRSIYFLKRALRERARNAGNTVGQERAEAREEVL